MTDASIVVVGAGALGASIAYHLVERGAIRVRLFERGGVAGGPTGASSAIIRQNYSNEITARMALDSLRYFQQAGADAGYRMTGCLSLVDAHEQAALAANLEMQQRIGIDVRAVSLDEALKIEPRLNLDGVVAVTYEPEAGYADPTLTASGMLERAREQGADVSLNTPVVGLVTRGERVVGIDTAAGRVDADIVVLATGPWTSALLEPLDIHLPIEVTRHTVLMYERPFEFRGLHPVVGDFPQGVYMRAEGDDLTLVGSLGMGPESAVDPDHFAAQVTSAESEAHAEPLVRRFPIMENATARGGWASVYDVTPDWHPILDELAEFRGLYVAAGTSGHGFKLSPAIGERVARLVLGDPGVELEMAFFARGRFARGHLVRGRYTHGIVG